MCVLEVLISFGDTLPESSWNFEKKICAVSTFSQEWKWRLMGDRDPNNEGVSLPRATNDRKFFHHPQNMELKWNSLIKFKT